MSYRLALLAVAAVLVVIAGGTTAYAQNVSFSFDGDFTAEASTPSTKQNFEDSLMDALSVYLEVTASAVFQITDLTGTSSLIVVFMTVLDASQYQPLANLVQSSDLFFNPTGSPNFYVANYDSFQVVTTTTTTTFTTTTSTTTTTAAPSFSCAAQADPLPIDLIFVLDNSNASTLVAYQQTIAAITAITKVLGSMISDQGVRLAFAMFSGDVCSSRNPCTTSFISNPILALETLSSMSFLGTSSNRNVQRMLTNFLFGSLYSQRRPTLNYAPTLLLFASSSSTDQLDVTIFNNWPTGVVRYVIDQSSTNSALTLISALTSSADRTAAITALLRAEPVSSSNVASFLTCPGNHIIFSSCLCAWKCLVFSSQLTD
jgi:hypothetical protein